MSAACNVWKASTSISSCRAISQKWPASPACISRQWPSGQSLIMHALCKAEVLAQYTSTITVQFNTEVLEEIVECQTILSPFSQPVPAETCAVGCPATGPAVVPLWLLRSSPAAGASLAATGAATSSSWLGRNDTAASEFASSDAAAGAGTGVSTAGALASRLLRSCSGQANHKSICKPYTLCARAGSHCNVQDEAGCLSLALL